MCPTSHVKAVGIYDEDEKAEIAGGCDVLGRDCSWRRGMPASTQLVMESSRIVQAGSLDDSVRMLLILARRKGRLKAKRNMVY